MERVIMKRLIVLFGLALAPTFVVGARARAVTLSYSGTIDRVVDANTTGLPTIDFTPIPAGSSFNGIFTYNANAPQTGGETGIALYYDLAPASGSVTINGLTFTTTNPGFANPALQVISQEFGVGFSGVAISTQPISLPVGWGVGSASFPYFTAQFFNEPAQSQSLALPTVASDFPLASARLILDFLEPVTVGGETFGDRVYVIGNITALSVDSAVAVPEPDSLTPCLISLAGLCGIRLVRRYRSANRFPPIR